MIETSRDWNIRKKLDETRRVYVMPARANDKTYTQIELYDLRPYICKQCGGRINPATMKCEFCGTEHYDPHLKCITISTVQPGEAVLRTEVRLSYEHMRQAPEHARDYALRELRNQLADGLLAYMKITTCEDFSPNICEHTEIIRGEVRVIDPMFEDRW